MERTTAYEGSDPYVFISCAQRDSDRVRPLIRKLQAEGLRVWYDKGLSKGRDKDAVLAGKIRECSFFLALLTDSWLESDTCRDGLDYARGLKKSLILVYLEEAALPDALRMRLARTEAIHWNREGEAKAFQKLLLTPGISACRITEGTEGAPGPDRPAPIDWGRAEYGDHKPAWIMDDEETAAPLPVSPGPEAEIVRPDPDEEIVPALPPEEEAEEPEGGRNGSFLRPSSSPGPAAGRKKRGLPLVPVLALVLLAALGLFFLLTRGKGQDQTQTASSGSFSGQMAEPEEAEDQEDDTEAGAGENDRNPALAELTSSVYENGYAAVDDCFPFAGTLVDESDSSYAYTEQQELDYHGETYQVARLPFVTISSYDDQRSMILGFYDTFDGQFFFYGTWSIEGGVLTVSPGGSPGTFAEECAPLTEALSFPFELRSGYLRITLGDYHVDLNGTQDLTGRLVLRGGLSEGSPAFDGMESLELVMDLDREEIISCELILEGGRRANVTSFSYWANIHTISLEWKTETYMFNGREVTEENSSFINLAYINQYPGGFIVIYTGEEYQAYYYQDLSDF